MSSPRLSEENLTSWRKFVKDGYAERGLRSGTFGHDTCVSFGPFSRQPYMLDC